MTKHKIKIGLLAISSAALAFTVFYSCKKIENKPQEEFRNEPNLEVSYDYKTKHAVNSDLATLGRVLFYDRKLSVNDNVACGSCHKQEFAFADNVQFNVGFNGMPLKRNSPSIQSTKGFFNTVTFDQNGQIQTEGRPTADNQAPVLLFWDGRQKTLSDMVLNPVLNHKEMNMPDFATLVTKLNNTSYYPTLFEKAFGDSKIDKYRISYALQGFIACLNTTTASPVDPNALQTSSFTQFEPIPPVKTTSTLTGLEEQGRLLFHNKYNCAKCHDPDPFNPGQYGGPTTTTSDRPTMFNIGLDEVYKDKGLGAITKLPGDNGLFKVPTLKNISVTAPYMHDGRFKNLDEVLDHYSHGIQASQNLSSLFVGFDGQPKKLNISAIEKKALIAFLNTLKDNDFLTSPMYSDPFKK